MASLKDQYVTAKGIRTRYWSAGKGGVPLVLLHGLGGTLEDWASVVHPLSKARRVVAIDLLGCGETDKPSNCTYAPDVMRDHVLATLDALGLDIVHLNGWSLGGRIALELAHANPDRLCRLILTAPAGIGKETILNLDAPLLELLSQAALRPGESGLRLVGNALRSDNAKHLFAFAARRARMVAGDRTRNAFLCQLRSFVGSSGYLAGPRQALVAKLPDIHLPSLAIWGKQDNFAPYDHAKILRAAMPQCRLHPIENCGHTPHLERPWVYVHAVNAFLT